jgi:formate-dependent nitrite reductase membrane component NrfD
MVPDAEFRSYYGLPILNRPVWEPRDIAGYLFLGGLAGAGAVMAAGAELTGRPALARTLKLGSFGAINLSVVALIHDLGRPTRLLNMLRTFKPTSPMSVGSWLVMSFSGVSGAAAVSEVTGCLPAIGAASTAGAAALGCGVATYTAALVADTAVPAWHDAHRDLPWVFASSAVASAAGLGLIGAPVAEAAPVESLGLVGGAAELVTEHLMRRRMGPAREAFEAAPAARYHRLSQILLAAGVATQVAGHVLDRIGRPGRRILNPVSGAALMAGSACTRFAVFHAGVASTEDPRYTVVPQRARLDRRSGRRGPG